MQTKSGKDVSRIGVGSYGVGGRGHRNMQITEKEEDDKYISALAYTLDNGSNFTEISLGYGHGQSMALFKKALSASTVSREDIFITHSLYPNDIDSIDTIYQDTADFYRIMDTDYADSTLVTQSLIIQIGESTIYPWLHELLTNGKTRYVSLSNASPTWIRRFKQEFGDALIAHEGHLSFEVRALQDKSVFTACDELGIENIIWRPLRRNKSLLHNWDLLVNLSEKYHKTQSQVILNWICEMGYRPMVFSTSKEHIDENLASLDFRMEPQDYRMMAEFRPKNYTPPKIDWETITIDTDIVLQTNNFEEYIDL